MMDSEEEEEQTALVCDNGKFRVKFRSKMTMVKKVDSVKNNRFGP